MRSASQRHARFLFATIRGLIPSLFVNCEGRILELAIEAVELGNQFWKKNVFCVPQYMLCISVTCSAIAQNGASITDRAVYPEPQAPLLPAGGQSL